MDLSSPFTLNVFYKKFFCQSDCSDFELNHHGVEISAILLVERSTINLLILYVTRENKL